VFTNVRKLRVYSWVSSNGPKGGGGHRQSERAPGGGVNLPCYASHALGELLEDGGPWLSYDPLTFNNCDLVPSSVGDGILSLQKERKRNSPMPDAPPPVLSTRSLTQHEHVTVPVCLALVPSIVLIVPSNSRSFLLRLAGSGNLRVAVVGRVAYYRLWTTKCIHSLFAPH